MTHLQCNLQHFARASKKPRIGEIVHRKNLKSGGVSTFFDDNSLMKLITHRLCKFCLDIHAGHRFYTFFSFVLVAEMCKNRVRPWTGSGCQNKALAKTRSARHKDEKTTPSNGKENESPTRKRDHQQKLRIVWFRLEGLDMNKLSIFHATWRREEKMARQLQKAGQGRGMVKTKIGCAGEAMPRHTISLTMTV